MPDEDIRCISSNKHLHASLKERKREFINSRDTDSGSLRSNSIGDGGRLGDCQKRPEYRERKTHERMTLQAASVHERVNVVTYCRPLAVCPVEMSAVVVRPEMSK